MDAPTIARALHGELVGRDAVVCPGPAHSMRDRSLSVLLDPAAPDGFLVYSHAGDPWPLCRAHVASLLRLPLRRFGERCRPAAPSDRKPAHATPQRARLVADGRAVRWSQKAEAIWSRTIRVGDQAAAPARRYLAIRQCSLPHPDGDLRYLHDAEHWPTRTRWPALVARITDTRTAEPLSLHLTFLAADGSGKALVEPQRLYLARHVKQGGIVRLWPDDEVTQGVLLGEGLETVLAGARAFQPAWAALDARNLAAFPVLAGIDSITLLVDDDETGRRAADACAARWRGAGREVRLHGR